MLFLVLFFSSLLFGEGLNPAEHYHNTILTRDLNVKGSVIQGSSFDQNGKIGCLSWNDKAISDFATVSKNSSLISASSTSGKGPKDLFHNLLADWISPATFEGNACQDLVTSSGKSCLVRVRAAPRENNKNEPADEALISRKCPESDANQASDPEPRISCRTYGDKMLWYRGSKSTSISDKPCFRWDWMYYDRPALLKFHSAFPIHFFKIYGRKDMTVHENFCRNPNRKNGPWCFVKGTGDVLYPEPCFLACGSKDLDRASGTHYLDKTGGRKCIAKSKWPWGEKCEFPCRGGKNVGDLKEMVEPVSLSPLIPWAAYSFHAAQMMSTSWDQPIKQEAEKDSFGFTIPRCFQYTQAQGPWSYYKTSMNEQLHNKLLYYLVHYLKGEITASVEETPAEMVSLWGKKGFMAYNSQYEEIVKSRKKFGKVTPCFYACEDVGIECIPKAELTSYQHFGDRNVALDGRSCLIWSEVADILLKNGLAQKFYLKDYNMASYDGKDQQDWILYALFLPRDDSYEGNKIRGTTDIPLFRWAYTGCWNLQAEWATKKSLYGFTVGDDLFSKGPVCPVLDSDATFGVSLAPCFEPCEDFLTKKHGCVPSQDRPYPKSDIGISTSSLESCAGEVQSSLETFWSRWKSGKSAMREPCNDLVFDTCQEEVDLIKYIPAERLKIISSNVVDGSDSKIRASKKRLQTSDMDEKYKAPQVEDDPSVGIALLVLMVIILVAILVIVVAVGIKNYNAKSQFYQNKHQIKKKIAIERKARAKLRRKNPDSVIVSAPEQVSIKMASEKKED